MDMFGFVNSESDYNVASEIAKFEARHSEKSPSRQSDSEEDSPARHVHISKEMKDIDTEAAADDGAGDDVSGDAGSDAIADAVGDAIVDTGADKTEVGVSKNVNPDQTDAGDTGAVPMDIDVSTVQTDAGVEATLSEIGTARVKDLLTETQQSSSSGDEGVNSPNPTKTLTDEIVGSFSSAPLRVDDPERRTAVTSNSNELCLDSIELDKSQNSHTRSADSDLDSDSEGLFGYSRSSFNFGHLSSSSLCVCS